MKRLMATKFWLTLLTLGLLPLTSLSAASQLSVIPLQKEGDIRSGYLHTVNLGESIEDVAVITNNSGRDFVVQVSAKDASYAANGGLAISKGSDDLGGWLTFEQAELTIPAGSSSEVKFQIAVPASASIGEHYAAIVVAEKSTIGSETPITANTSVRVIVPGKVQRQMSWGKISHSFEDGKLVFDVRAKNGSNIHLQPSLDIQYLGILGKARQTELAKGSVAPGETIKFETTWQHQTPIIGLYRYKLTLHTLSVVETLPDGTVNNLADETIVTDYSFTTGGKLLTGIILGLLILWLWFRCRVWMRDKQKYMTHVTPHKVKAGESLIHIATSTGIQPKKLIKFNRLSWPYTVAAGETILIPGGRLHRDELLNKHPEDRLRSFFAYIFSIKPTLYHPMTPPAQAPTRAKPTQKVSVKKSPSKKKNR